MCGVVEASELRPAWKWSGSSWHIDTAQPDGLLQRIGPGPGCLFAAAPPAAVIDYLKGFVRAGSGKQYIGHNPAGGWMVIALLLSLLATGLSWPSAPSTRTWKRYVPGARFV